MNWRHMRGALGVLILAAALVSAPLAASASTHKSKHQTAAKHHAVVKHPKAKASKTASAKTGAGSIALTCTDLGGEQTKTSQLETSLEQAFASGNFATIKQAMLAEFTELDQAIAEAQSELSSAPADVKAAFTTVANAFKQLEASIQSSTSLPQLELAFTSLGSNAQLKSASEILSSYYDSECGITTTTTST
jgi:hypothetical protein